MPWARPHRFYDNDPFSGKRPTAIIMVADRTSIFPFRRAFTMLTTLAIVIMPPPVYLLPLSLFGLLPLPLFAPVVNPIDRWTFRGFSGEYRQQRPSRYNR
jgi:hypothetical protein